MEELKVGDRVWHTATGTGYVATVLATIPAVPDVRRALATVLWDGDERVATHPQRSLHKVAP